MNTLHGPLGRLQAPYLLALQGGGSFGAFTAGMLHVLLSDPRLPLPGALSGTSAGALNAAVVADALASTKNEARARKAAADALETLWLHAIPDMAADYIRQYYGWFGWGMPKASLQWFHDAIMSMWSNVNWMPLARVPASMNPLFKALAHIDFERLNNSKRPVYIAATHVEGDTGVIFSNGNLSTAAIVASTALPDLFEPIPLGGEHYMEGAYHHNPPLMQPARDGWKNILMVHLNGDDGSLKKTAKGTKPKPREVPLFDRPLVRDLALLAKRRDITLIDTGMDPEDGFKATKKLHTSKNLFEQLFAAGQEKARQLLNTSQAT